MCEADIRGDLYETRTGKITEYADVKMLPDQSSDILCWLNVGSEVMVELGESTQKYYKVCTVSGIEGWCSRKYVEII